MHKVLLQRRKTLEPNRKGSVPLNENNLFLSFNLKNKKQDVDEKQKEILDSIHYAKRIQTALITSEKYIEKNLNKLNNKV